MEWRKKGKIDYSKWMHMNKYASEFATLPTPIVIDDEIIRIFVGFCDNNNVGTISYIDVLADNPSEVVNISAEPVIRPGRDGCFDDNGVVPLSVVRKGDDIYLYYVGFQLGVKIPYFMFGGLAISSDNGKTFSKVSNVPVLDRRDDELFARCGMFVTNTLFEGYKMWYIGTIGGGWTRNGDSVKPLYTMRYTHSDNGIDWNFGSEICMNFENKDEHGFGRPYVWFEDEKYKMLYSVRTYSRGYYIGYAEADDEVHWTRKDALAGIDVSETGWDSVNIGYPVVICHKDRKYLFYNGNGCGRTGFGYAVLV